MAEIMNPIIAAIMKEGFKTSCTSFCIRIAMSDAV
jgi:hypothetical protein